MPGMGARAGWPRSPATTTRSSSRVPPAVIVRLTRLTCNELLTNITL